MSVTVCDHVKGSKVVNSVTIDPVPTAVPTPNPRGSLPATTLENVLKGTKLDDTVPVGRFGFWNIILEDDLESILTGIVFDHLTTC